MPCRVKRPTVHTSGGVSDQSLYASKHFLGGSAREGQEKDALGLHASIDEVGDAVNQRARLARAGAGDDKQRTIGVRGGC